MINFAVALKCLWAFVALGLYGRVASQTPPGSVVMKIINNCGLPIDLYWVNSFEKSRPLVRQTTTSIRNNTDTIINSYDGHQFILKFAKPIGSAVEPQVAFSKGAKEETINVFYTPEAGMTMTQVTKFDELLVKVKAQSSSCSELTGDDFDRCFAAGIAEDVIVMEDKKNEVVKYRDLMANRLRNYTCADEKMETSEALYNKTIYFGAKKYLLEVLFDSPAAKIWVIDNFISPEECQILHDHGKTRLQRATVSGPDGKSLVSESRKAQQASYNLHDPTNGDPLLPLKSKVLSITNEHSGYKLQGDGQEDFTIIQYNKADEYVPHCDGSCDGTDYKSGGRVATAVMYCQVAEKGGGTTFTKADIFVKPKAGMATFFSYKGPNGKMEDGYTEHSGCPVLQGEKWITTAWMREGVSRESPSDIFDPSGERIEDMSGDSYADEEAEEHAEEAVIEDSEDAESNQNSNKGTDGIITTEEEVGGIKTVEAAKSGGWMGGIVGNLNNWKSGFGKKVEIQTDL